MRIDSHQHFWRIADRAGQWPPPSLAAIHRDFEPADLHGALARCGIEGTVLVQSLPTLADTASLLELAARHPFVLGVVGWVDMTRFDAPRQIAGWAANAKLKGLRPMLQDHRDERWADAGVLDAAVDGMVAHDLAFDALIRADQLNALLRFARRHPALRIVIDHAAKPPIERAALQPWADDIAALAELPNVCCKLSGLLTESGPHADALALTPYVEHLFAVFGPGRLMWGSDWPVLCLAGEYDGWFALAGELCAAQRGIDAAALADIFGGNAQRFYRTGQQCSP